MLGHPQLPAAWSPAPLHRSNPTHAFRRPSTRKYSTRARASGGCRRRRRPFRSFGLSRRRLSFPTTSTWITGLARSVGFRTSCGLSPPSWLGSSRLGHNRTPGPRCASSALRKATSLDTVHRSCSLDRIVTALQRSTIVPTMQSRSRSSEKMSADVPAAVADLAYRLGFLDSAWSLRFKFFVCPW